jgi:hypothetical protein
MALQGHAQAPKPGRKDRRFFTLEQANRSLPYVSRIIEDIRSAYQQAMTLQQRMDRPMPDDTLQSLQQDYQQSIDRLNRFVEELSAVGVELKDYDMGLVDFPARHEGREVCLCWRRGEAKIEAWHEVDSGFAGRQEIGSFKAE